MQKLFLVPLVALFLVSCNSSRKIQRYQYLVEEPQESSPETTPIPPAPSPKPNPTPPPTRPAPTPASPSSVNKLIKKAQSFEGTPYKYGGTTRKGMDCSGLVYTAYQSIGKTLPRISRDMPSAGTPVKRNKLQRGDLVFFHSSGGKTINHVGIVVAVSGSSIQFIHATTSRGVRTDELNEGYWKDKYLKAVRVKI